MRFPNSEPTKLGQIVHGFANSLRDTLRQTQLSRTLKTSRRSSAVERFTSAFVAKSECREMKARSQATSRRESSTYVGLGQQSVGRILHGGCGGSADKK